jgi:hypothetical protein
MVPHRRPVRVRRYCDPFYRVGGMPLGMTVCRAV